MKIITTNNTLATFGFFDRITNSVKNRAKKDTEKTVKGVAETFTNEVSGNVKNQINDFVEPYKKKYGKYFTKRNLKIAGGLGAGLLALNVASGVKNTIDLARGAKNLVFKKPKKKENKNLVTVGNYTLQKKLK